MKTCAWCSETEPLYRCQENLQPPLDFCAEHLVPHLIEAHAWSPEDAEREYARQKAAR